MSQYEEQARTAFKRGDYMKAIGLYDRAIGRTPTVRLYDNCAACYEQLDNLPSALKNAKQAIQFAKDDPTGYLRAGQILVKMGKKGPALEVYGYGLRHVQHVGQRYEVRLLAAHAFESLLTKLFSAFARHTQNSSVSWHRRRASIHSPSYRVSWRNRCSTTSHSNS